MKRVILTILFLSPLIVPIIPLLRPEYFTMHDSQHIVRLYLLDKAVHQGQWYPRWVDGLGFGFGYPLYNFYPPLIYYVALLFRLFGMGYIWSIKFMLIIGFALSYAGMYGLLWELTKKKSIAFFGAFLFLLAPYHAVLVYVRGAFAEFFGYSLVPWVSWGFVRMMKGKPSILFILSLALLMLAHPFVSFPFMLFFGIAFCIALFLIPTWSKRVALTVRTLLSAVLALGLSAFYWMPSMVERSFTLVNSILLTQDADFHDHFIYFRQLWSSPWGYGGSAGMYSGLSFEIGKVHIILFLIGILVVAATMLRRKAVKLQGVFFVTYVLFFIAVFMTNVKSLWLWEHLSLLTYMQFPWRMLVFIVFFVSVGAVMWLIFVKKKLRWGIITLAVTLSLFLYAPLYRPASYISGSDALQLSDEKVYWEVSKSSFEFMYRDIQTKKNGSTTEFALAKNNIPPLLFSVGRNSSITVILDNYSNKKFTGDFTKQETFVLNRSYFPGWHAYIDKQEVPIKKQGKAATMAVTVPAGSHSIEYIYKNTPIRSFATVVSVLSFLLLFYFIQRERRFLAETGKSFNESEGKR